MSNAQIIVDRLPAALGAEFYRINVIDNGSSVSLFFEERANSDYKQSSAVTGAGKPLSGGGFAAPGSPGNVIFNSAGAFAGMDSTSWDDVNHSLTIQGGPMDNGSFPILQLSQEWTVGGTFYTGILFNVTDTASQALSALMDLQVGNITQFFFQKNGLLKLSDLQFFAGQQALGAGAAATLGTIGAPGPGTAAQDSWQQVRVADGSVRWVPLWI